MASDSRGFLYVATKFGVQVCDRNGKVTAVIDHPQKAGVANVFFAGRGLNWLYMTDGDKMYRRRMKR